MSSFAKLYASGCARPPATLPTVDVTNASSAQIPPSRGDTDPLVLPPARQHLAVAVVGAWAPYGYELQAVRAGFEAPRDGRCDSDHVPLLDLFDLVVELHSPGA